VNPRVAEVLLGAERESLAEMEEKLGRSIEVRAVPGVHQEHFEVIALEEGPPVPLRLPWLGLGEDSPDEAEPVLFSEPFEDETPAPSPAPDPFEPGLIEPGLIEGRPEVALADAAPDPEPEPNSAKSPTTRELDLAGAEEPDPTHAAPTDELAPPERRTLVALALSPVGAGVDADVQPVDEAPESRILPASSEPEA